MVKDLKAQGLLPRKPVLQARSRVERLGKYPMENPPESNEMYPILTAPYEPVFNPVAITEGAPSSSRIGPLITPKVNSVIVVPSHDDE